MKKFYFLFLFLFCLGFSKQMNAQVCNANGNLVIYSNYDGGIIYINCDVNIPNLKIGIETYEAAKIYIQGTYASNVTQVIYAGYNGTNDNCGLGVTTTSVSGVSSSIVSILFAPSVGYNTTNGSPNMVCAYSCDSSTSQGGCNTPDQVVYYFEQATGGTLYSHHTQYSCWNNLTTSVSSGGNCCIVAPGGGPVASFTADTTAGCAGQCITFTNTSTGGPFTSTSWTFPGGTPSTSTASSPTVCYASAGSYDVTLNVSGSSGTDAITQNNYVVINAAPAIPVITQSGSLLTSTFAVTYQWNFNSAPISGATGQTYNATQNGVYTVTVTNASGCSATSSPLTVAGLSLEELAVINFKLWPNPATEQFFIELGNAEGTYVVEILNASGTLVNTYTNIKNNYTVNTSQLSAGIYLIRLSGENKNSTQRLQILR